MTFACSKYPLEGPELRTDSLPSFFEHDLGRPAMLKGKDLQESGPSKLQVFAGFGDTSG